FDRIEIINKGKIVALDPPENLKASISGEKYFEIKIYKLSENESNGNVNSLKDFNISCFIKHDFKKGKSILIHTIIGHFLCYL
ncbi:MAG: hypothetical protein ACPLSA_05315, partial [Caldanaerobacter sp.]